MSWRRLLPGVMPVSGWAEGLNFVGPRVRTSFWGWALLAFGLIGLWHAADLRQQVQGELQEAQSLIDRLQRGERAQAVVDPRPLKTAQADAATATPAAAPSLHDEGWRQASQLAQWLGHPWAQTLDHVDAASLQEGAVLMQFSLDLATLGSQAGVVPEMRLQAAVIDDASAWRWLQALGPKAVMRSREPLAEGFATSRGAYALRVDVIGSGGRP